METANEINSDLQIGILFVDDERNVLQSLRRLFIDEDGYSLNVATSGEEALDILKNNPDIGLIVSDQRMPGMKGAEFLEKARGLLPDSIRILLTGYADINAVADAINKGGAYRYITKPWNDEELLQIIREATRRFSLIRENKRLQEIVSRQNEELKKWNSQLEYFVQEQTVEIQRKNDELNKLNENLKKNFKNTIFAFSSLLSLRDKGTGNHSKNVAELSVKIARGMSLSGADIESIMVAALLHDIGKIGMPDVLLLREFEEMDLSEKKEYMQHAVRGQAAVDSVEALRTAGILIRHHHEWFNGSGFPDKLLGEKIPLGARIIAFADFIERMQRGINGENAVDIALKKTKEGLGTRFDEKIYSFAEGPAREFYSKFTMKTNMAEVELDVADIKPGMVLARDVKSGTGLILLSKGVALNDKNVQALRRYYLLDPSKTGIYVVSGGKT